jgi:nicotinate-nucleotide adenylyltransferase
VHIGLFGGSFDPPHICHTLFCLYVLEMTDVEKILWAPCLDHPFGKTAADYEHRLAMSRLAVALLAPRVEVSDIERTLPRPSYTIHTVEALRRQWPEARISILVGSDILGEIERWARIEELRRLAEFFVVPRGGNVAQASCLSIPFVASGEEVTVALPELSSTAIRDALRRGLSMAGVLSPAVCDYIARHGLYQFPA